VWINSNTIKGGGAIEVMGGEGCAGGGGGAVSIAYTDTASSLPTVRTTAGRDWCGGRPGGPGTYYVFGPSATYGSVYIDNTGRAVGATELPTFGAGSAIAGSADATLVTSRTTDIPDYFVRHWIEVRDAGGNVKGTWRIASVSGKSFTLAPNGSETIFIEPGDTYSGLYRFDTMTVRVANVASADRIVSTSPPVLENATLSTNDGPPLFVAAKRSQIVVDSQATGDAIVGPAGAVTDSSTPIKLVATNTRTGVASATVNANADGSFRVPVNGEAGDTFTLVATDSHTLPLTSASIAVNGSIVEMNRIATLEIRPASVSGGTTAYGTVTLTHAARAAGVVVSLESDTAGVTVPASIRVPGGTLSLQFSITTGSVSTVTTPVITATVAGVSKSASFTILPSTAGVVEVQLSSTSVEGGTSVNGTVVLGAPAPAGGAVVMLDASTPSARVPATVLVAEGDTQAAFTVQTTKVAALTNNIITATWSGATSASLDVTPCAELTTVNPPSSVTLNTIWVNDALPANATQTASDAAFDETQVALGTKAIHFAPPTTTQVRSFAFTGAAPLAVTTADNLSLYALINPCNPPRQILGTWTDGTAAGTRRASWGESRIGSTADTQTRIGAIPAGGEWVRLDALAKTLGIAANTNITGLTISVDGGEAWFDAAGVAACSLTKQAKPEYAPYETVFVEDGLPAGATSA
ncbi:MAG: hypothetical protein ACLGH0_13720, partial [Thermoanaerobaculia bacterium]